MFVDSKMLLQNKLKRRFKSNKFDLRLFKTYFNSIFLDTFIPKLKIENL